MTVFTASPGDELLTTAILSDSLDECGVHDGVLERHLASLVPGSRAFGRAATARFVASQSDEPDDPYRSAIDFIDGLQAGEFVVLATSESNASAFWGELFSAAAIGAGAVGIVTDGNVRDAARIAALGFPAFSRSRRPIDYRRRMVVADVRQPVTLGGVRVDAGDLVMADDDGVVVIPRAREAEVLAAARRRVAGESTVLAELLAGESLRSVWDRHRIL
jgi:4-hydroxy-4-methyl-2-oxoglutarate aldolase